MKCLRSYRFGLDFWAMGLFLLVMLPNFIWFGLPAQNDVLRRESIVPVLDGAVSAFQILTVVSLCFLKNHGAGKFCWKRPRIWGAAGCCICYYGLWLCYYSGVVNAALILGLCLFPCGAFFLFGLGRKKLFALVFIVLFATLHTLSSLINFFAR